MRYMMLALAAPSVQQYVGRLSPRSRCAHLLALFVGLVVLKVVVGVGLVYYATSVRAQDAELFLHSPAPVTQGGRRRFAAERRTARPARH